MEPDSVILYGASYSVYVRIARLVLEECGVAYRQVEFDIFDHATVPDGYQDRHPFGKIPALEHKAFRLFESDAIAAYLVELFGAGRLRAKTAQKRARATQVMRILDHYAYPRLVWGVFVQETEKARARQLSAAEIEAARHCLAVLDGLAEQPFLVGDCLTLADLWAVPMLGYLRLAPTGKRLIEEFPKLTLWWELMDQRPSVQGTRFAKELEEAR